MVLKKFIDDKLIIEHHDLIFQDKFGVLKVEARLVIQGTGIGKWRSFCEVPRDSLKDPSPSQMCFMNLSSDTFDSTADALEFGIALGRSKMKDVELVLQEVTKLAERMKFVGIWKK